MQVDQLDAALASAGPGRSSTAIRLGELPGGSAIEVPCTVFRGKDGFGLETMLCPICHQSVNFDPGRVPGHPTWHLAPREMAWEGKTISQICVQIKDPARNGNRPLHALIEHIGTDTLVGWVWAPGFGRRPAPGTV